MSAKTKIVVLRMKELIYTGIFATLGLLLVVLLIMMFLPDSESNSRDNPPAKESGDAAPTASGSLYIPGIYTTELVLGGQTVDVEVIVEQDSISSIRLVNLSEAVTTMYPLLEPTLNSICEQVYTNQSLEGISYTDESKYTSLVLLEAIQNSLDKALVSDTTIEEAVPDEVSGL
uniref:hypothetical protein n=1 Tax=Acetatifactor sp. TaxID=1872090 RepID=UPI0040562AAE